MCIIPSFIFITCIIFLRTISFFFISPQFSGTKTVLKNKTRVFTSCFCPWLPSKWGYLLNTLSPGQKQQGLAWSSRLLGNLKSTTQVHRMVTHWAAVPVLFWGLFVLVCCRKQVMKLHVHFSVRTLV